MAKQWHLVTENYEPSWTTGVSDNHVQLLLIEQVAEYLNQLEADKAHLLAALDAVMNSTNHQEAWVEARQFLARLKESA